MEIDKTKIEYKTFTIKEADVDLEKREFTAIISNESLDRDKECILATGLSLKEYKKNGVILAFHDTHMPIGKALDVKRVGNDIIMKGKLATGVAKADEVWQLIKQGCLKACSIGFSISEARHPTREDMKNWGKDIYRVISKSILLEVSIVSVPANQQALISSCKELNIDPKIILGDEYKEEEIVEEETKETKTEMNSDLRDLIEQVKTELREDIKRKDLKDTIKKELIINELIKNGELYY